MLGLGWTEMLVIGVVALIVIGPRDLPEVMGRIGKVMGQIRRMGNEFQREINRTTGLDEVRNLRQSITSPLKKTADEIRREFNAMTPTGQKPSGVLKPADPKVESVVDEIRDKVGMAPAAAPKTNDQIAADAGFKSTKPGAQPQSEPAKTGAVGDTVSPKPAKKAPARKVPVKAKPAVNAAASTRVRSTKRPKPIKTGEAKAEATPMEATVENPVEPQAVKPRTRRKKTDNPAGNS